uniref:C-type lectin domain-containing protein n=1 Tax=Gopherus evgoodei TaxID=1825980 RepID=A0A8C5EYW2_9SAUR
HTYNPPGMSEQEVTYTELKHHTPSEQLRSQRPRNSESKGIVSPPWRIIAVILGILCLVSLGAVVALAAKGNKFNPCPENWRRHGDYCYYFSTKWKTWQESKDYCLSLGSNLLKIKNKEELVISYPSVPRVQSPIHLQSLCSK